MTIGEKIKNFIHKEADALSIRLKAIFNSNEVKAIENGMKAELKTALGQLAVKAVTDVQTNLAGAPNADKAAAAFKQVVADATTAGHSFTENLVNRLITSAVEAAKDHLVAPAPSPSPASGS